MSTTNISIEHTTVQTNGITLHVVLAGPADGPPVILLHGFPEYWGGWQAQIPALAEAGYRVWAPDQRGYNLSAKPAGVRAYDIDQLARDVLGLIDATGQQQVRLVGHDWGAAVAWWVAGKYPERLHKLAILNVPHLSVMFGTLWRSWAQMRKSWYIFFFQLPRLPEASLRRNGWTNAIRALKGSSRRGTFTPEQIEQYRQAWSQPGAITGMINWYRAAGRTQRKLRQPGPHHRAHADDLGRQRLRPGPRDGPAQHRPVRQRPAGVHRGGRALRTARGAGAG